MYGFMGKVESIPCRIKETKIWRRRGMEVLASLDITDVEVYICLQQGLMC